MNRKSYKSSWYLKNKDRIQKKHKDYYYQLKQLVLKEYGEKCQLCNSIENLEFDHKFGFGTLHRRLDSSPRSIIFFLRKQGFPKDRFRLLCRKCNVEEYWRRKTL